jgi:methylation protein EvaC
MLNTQTRKSGRMSNCHLCGDPIDPVLDFGRQPLANSYPLPGEEDRVWYNAVWGWCEACQMLQLIDVPDVGLVFNASYPYITDQSRFMVGHFYHTAIELESRYEIAGKKVLEIGANSGGMIEHLRHSKVIAVEPASASQTILSNKGIPFWDALFTEKVAQTILSNDGKFALIYSANTLRSLVDLDDFFKGVVALLDEGGVFVFEEPYLPSILDRNEFDQFYSENVYGFTVTAVDRLARRHGLGVISADWLPQNHGGSVRYHLARIGAGVDDLSDFHGRETRIRARCAEMYEHALRIKDSFRQALIKSLRGSVGYGATAKSATILNWSGIGPSLISKIYDSTPTKIGRVTPGTHIPIVDAAQFPYDSTETIVLFPYNLKQEIIPRENDVRKRQWLLYAPEVHYD